MAVMLQKICYNYESKIRYQKERHYFIADTGGLYFEFI